MNKSAEPQSYSDVVRQRRESLAAELQAIFPNPVGLVWEVGSGHGHFLTAYAGKHPEATCLGLDIIADRVARANRKRDRARLSNLHFLHTDARSFLETAPLHLSISRVLILFPDPWPKKRHHKHRIVQPEFLTLLRSRVSPDAELFFRTDDVAYFEHASRTVGDHPLWRLTSTPWPFEHETVFQQRAKTYHSLGAEPQP